MSRNTRAAIAPSITQRARSEAMRTRRRDRRSARTDSHGEVAAAAVKRTNRMIPTAPAPPASYA